MNRSYADRDGYKSSIEPRMLKVTGTATNQAAPDQAVITLGVITEDVDPHQAQMLNSQTVAVLIPSLLSLDIQEEDLKTSEYRIEPQYDYVEGKEVFKHYKVTYVIQVTTHDTQKIGFIIDQAVQNGANLISSIRFSLSDPETYYRQALSLALQDAQEKAISMARTLGISLHAPPRYIEEVTDRAISPVYQASQLSSTPIRPSKRRFGWIIPISGIKKIPFGKAKGIFLLKDDCFIFMNQNAIL